MTHGQAMTSTMLQPDGLGSHSQGEHMGSNTREGLAQEKAAVGRKGLLGGNSRAGGGQGSQDTHELWPSVRQAQGHLLGLGEGTISITTGSEMLPESLVPQGGTAGLTGGPWGPGGPGVCEEHAQADGKAGQDSPSFWEKGDPHH